jgi:predicted GIY-YIG superfamily endonuclease
MYHTCVLMSLKDGRRCIGYTANLRRRLEQHNPGLVAATRSRQKTGAGPVALDEAEADV